MARINTVSASGSRSPSNVSATRLVAWIVAGQLAGLAVLGAYVWVRVFYFRNLDAIFYISSRAHDMPPTPGAPLTIGVHTFGDFLLPFEQSLVPNTWTDYRLAMQPYPSALVTLFKIFTALPYGIALPLYLAASAASMLVPMLSATRHLPATGKVAASCLLTLLTAPFIIALDRGNVQALLVIPFYLFARAWRLRQWWPATAALVAAAVLKLYPLVLIVVLFAERKWKAAAVACAASCAITLALFRLYPGPLHATLSGFAHSLQQFSAHDALTLEAHNYSLTGMLVNLLGSTVGLHSPLVTVIAERPWLAGAAYLLFVATLLFAQTLPFVAKLALALSLLSQVVSISYGYSLVFVYVIVGELVRQAVADWEAGTRSDGIPALLAVPLAWAVTLTLIPNPLPLPDRLSSLATIVDPAAWSVFALACAAEVVRRRAARPRSRSTR